MVGTAVMAFSYCYLYAAQWGRNEMDAEMPRQMRAARLGPRGTLLCDVCDKPHKTLGLHPLRPVGGLRALFRESRCHSGTQRSLANR